MKTDIILAGVGGQGILSIAASLGAAALNENYYLKQAETHGMSQRGGAVVSHLRIADHPIHSDLIPLGAADLILSVEPMESLRYLPHLAPGGSLVTNTIEFKNIPNYPELESTFEELSQKINIIRIDADQIAKDTGNPKASNMVMLGAASPFIAIHDDIIIKGIESIFKAKGDKIVEMNVEAFKAGRTFSTKNK
ncbi:indolepyruvate ferredoxin oxidoreductase beta subunit [Mariniphaga anaerophila]|uniref:Indolepyruvate ferredoxin oxidoreductase beta subunit n=1 Tax=Mariniphaga anaerophila TaxID=1484053 RepID=A0A1M5GC23_9BACT|nr:indolepyruvate oxidoreductase subunit beta [Mariniphaga anaerophila]SHG01264.1 indolepyruvate ferredoxin oxidoreductase beta subunit [Mariniphaga anaerophila]